MTSSKIIEQQRLFLSFLPLIRKQFGNLSGVHIIGLGGKEKKGKLLDEWAYRFYVEKKRPIHLIPDKERIPDHIFGVQTDVILHFEKESLICNEGDLDANNDEYRDSGIRGGISIRNEHFENDHPSGYGTLGILARRTSDNALVGLTCAHVVNAASESPTTLNTKIGQPKYWISCCCCPRGHIGDVIQVTSSNDLDCALIEIHDDIREKVTTNSTENKVEDMASDISGAAAIICFDNLSKYGRATGLTTGKVSDIAYGTNHMLIERTDGNPGDPFACYGDSGAVIVNSGNQVVGILVAAAKADMTRGIATHIKPVMTELGITIAGTDAATIGEPVGGGTTGCELFAWPGGQSDNALNPMEVFNSTDFGFTGNVDWDVSGGASGAVIVETGSQTASSRSSISVRYDTTSATKNATDAVWVKAIDGSEEVTKFRTVFTFTPRLVNTSSALDSDNIKRFAATGGTNTQAGAAFPGTDGASWFLAKAEIVYDILPQDLQWSGSGGISFEVGAPAGIEGNIVSRRQTTFTKGEQANGASNRTHTDQTEWISAGDSSVDDFQGPTDAVPNELFRLANEGFHPANLLQGYLRADFRDYLEFHNGSDWIRITAFAEWFANLTANLSGTGSPPPTVGTTNTLGAGANTVNIPNQQPTIAAIAAQEVKPGDQVTLTATPNDPDNDALTVGWNQTNVPAFNLGVPVGNTWIFNAPLNDPQLKFEATADDGTDVLSRKAGNHLSNPAEAIVNVVEWKNIGGGDLIVDRNMTEDFNAADFGIGPGALNWDVTIGGTNAVIIEADGAAVAPAGTHNGATTIKVRYDNRSGDLTRAQTVKIQATHPGSGKVWFKRRTVFRVTVAVHATDTRTHMIPSTLGASGKDHFCTVKNASNMILHATLDPVPPDAQITWNATGRAITSPSVGGDRKTAHINRNPASGLEIPINVRVDNWNVYEGTCWILWSTIVAVPGVVGPTTFEFRPGTNRIGRDITFNCTIQPATIITATPTVDDLPDLTGTNRSNAGVLVPAPDVIAGDVGVARATTSLAAGATKKWDVSRQIRVSIPDFADVAAGLAAFAHYVGNYPNYPSAHPIHSDAIGNDDEHDNEENNNPYTNGGIITGFDLPNVDLPHGFVNVGDTFEIRLHFREFTRVLLDNVWYRSSNFLLWRSHMKGIKVSEASDSRDYDLDGNQTDIFWIDNGTDIALNNNGF